MPLRQGVVPRPDDVYRDHLTVEPRRFALTSSNQWRCEGELCLLRSHLRSSRGRRVRPVPGRLLRSPLEVPTTETKENEMGKSDGLKIPVRKPTRVRRRDGLTETMWEYIAWRDEMRARVDALVVQRHREFAARFLDGRS